MRNLTVAALVALLVALVGAGAALAQSGGSFGYTTVQNGDFQDGCSEWAATAWDCTSGQAAWVWGGFNPANWVWANRLDNYAQTPLGTTSATLVYRARSSGSMDVTVEMYGGGVPIFCEHDLTQEFHDYVCPLPADLFGTRFPFRLAVAAGWPGSQVWIDDVRVEYTVPEPTPTPSPTPVPPAGACVARFASWSFYGLAGTWDRSTIEDDKSYAECIAQHDPSDDNFYIDAIAGLRVPHTSGAPASLGETFLEGVITWDGDGSPPTGIELDDTAYQWGPLNGEFIEDSTFGAAGDGYDAFWSYDKIDWYPCTGTVGDEGYNVLGCDLGESFADRIEGSNIMPPVYVRVNVASVERAGGFLVSWRWVKAPVLEDFCELEPPAGYAPGNYMSNACFIEELADWSTSTSGDGAVSAIFEMGRIACSTPAGEGCDGGGQIKQTFTAPRSGSYYIAALAAAQNCSGTGCLVNLGIREISTGTMLTEVGGYTTGNQTADASLYQIEQTLTAGQQYEVVMRMVISGDGRSLWDDVRVFAPIEPTATPLPTSTTAPAVTPTLPAAGARDGCYDITADTVYQVRPSGFSAYAVVWPSEISASASAPDFTSGGRIFALGATGGTVRILSGGGVVGRNYAPAFGTEWSWGLEPGNQATIPTSTHITINSSGPFRIEYCPPGWGYPTATPTRTPTSTPTRTPTVTRTPAATRTPTTTRTPTLSPTPSPSWTPVATHGATATLGPSPTFAPTWTPVATSMPTPVVPGATETVEEYTGLVDLLWSRWPFAVVEQALDAFWVDPGEPAPLRLPMVGFVANDDGASLMAAQDGSNLTAVSPPAGGLADFSPKAVIGASTVGVGFIEIDLEPVGAVTRPLSAFGVFIMGAAAVIIGIRQTFGGKD